MQRIISQSGHTAYGHVEYAVDTIEDLDYLPLDIPMGSVAIVISTGSVYMINGKREWVEI